MRVTGVCVGNSRCSAGAAHSSYLWLSRDRLALELGLGSAINHRLGKLRQLLLSHVALEAVLAVLFHEEAKQLSTKGKARHSDKQWL